VPPFTQLFDERPRNPHRTAHRKAAENERADPEAQRIDPDRPSGPDGRDERPAEDRAGDVRGADGEEEQRVRLLQPFRRHRLRRQPARGRVVERGRGAAHGREHEHVPQLRAAGDQEYRQQALRREPREVRADHQALSRQPVRPDAAGKDEPDEGQRTRREHEAESGRGAAEIEDRERERDGRDVVAEHRDAARDE